MKRKYFVIRIVECNSSNPLDRQRVIGRYYVVRKHSKNYYITQDGMKISKKYCTPYPINHFAVLD